MYIRHFISNKENFASAKPFGAGDCLVALITLETPRPDVKLDLAILAVVLYSLKFLLHRIHLIAEILCFFKVKKTKES